MSLFSNLQYNVAVGVSQLGFNSTFSLSRYKKRDGQLKFYSPRGYESMYVYAVKRTLMQTAFAKINDLYPGYLRNMDRKSAKAAYLQNQGQEVKKIIENGKKMDEETRNKMGVVLKYRGKAANEGLLLWIPTEDGKTQTLEIQTYWDKIKNLSTNESGNTESVFDNTKIEVPGSIAFCDLGANVSSQSSNNLILTKVQGRDYSRKELVSGGDINFTVTGKIVSNYPDIYPYEDVSKFVKLMQYKGILKVYNILFQQYNVTQILIKDFQMGQDDGFKNVQPYQFTCVAVEPDEVADVVTDTINAQNITIAHQKKKGWTTLMLNQVKAAAANQAAQLVESLIADTI